MFHCLEIWWAGFVLSGRHSKTLHLHSSLFCWVAVSASYRFPPCSPDESTMMLWRLSAGSVVQTPLINRPIGTSCLNGTASSTSKEIYLHGCVRGWVGEYKSIQVYVHPSSKPPKSELQLIFLFPSLKRATYSVNDKAYKRIQAI